MRFMLPTFLFMTLTCFVFANEASKDYIPSLDNKPASQKIVKDKLVSGQSATERRANPTANQKIINNGQSIKGSDCMTSDGVLISSKDKRYTKCVDNANRIK